MTLPSIVLGIFISITIAVAFAFIRGSNLSQLLIYIFVGTNRFLVRSFLWTDYKYPCLESWAPAAGRCHLNRTSLPAGQYMAFIC